MEVRLVRTVLGAVLFVISWMNCYPMCWEGIRVELSQSVGLLLSRGKVLSRRSWSNLPSINLSDKADLGQYRCDGESSRLEKARCSVVKQS